jgi:hypothetical protein
MFTSVQTKKEEGHVRQYTGPCDIMDRAMRWTYCVVVQGIGLEDVIQAELPRPLPLLIVHMGWIRPVQIPHYLCIHWPCFPRYQLCIYPCTQQLPLCYHPSVCSPHTGRPAALLPPGRPVSQPSTCSEWACYLTKPVTALCFRNFASGDVYKRGGEGGGGGRTCNMAANNEASN